MHESEFTWLNPLNGGYIIMPSPFWQRANEFVSPSENSTEAGGLIIGKLRGPHIEVTDITEPCSSDIRSHTSFIRRDSHHAKYAFARWKNSNKTETFLGEWHSHPERVPTPSPIDLRSWHRLIFVNRKNMFFIILGTEGHWAGFASITDGNLKITQAILISGRGH